MSSIIDFMMYPLYSYSTFMKGKPEMKTMAWKFSTTLLLMILLGTLVGVQPVYAASIVVNSNADAVANDGACTLREAITAANTNAASGATAGECIAGDVAGTDAISFAANYEITLTSQLPAITSAMTITGNGAANSVVRADACDPLGGFCTQPYRVFEVGAAGDLTLDGLTVKHGRCFSGTCTTNSGQGGNILNAGILHIANSIITNATALSGGNIFNNGGTITVIASQINNGRAYDGGGIYNISGTTTLSQVTMSGDQSVGLEGAAINNQATLTVTNSTFSGNGDFINNTGAAAGAIYNSPTGTATITNSSISGNAGGLSGGIHNIGVLHLQNTILANNFPIDCYNSIGDTIATNTNNLIEVNAASGHMCGTPTLTSDPMLGALANNGGLTPTFALLAGSPAIDKGNNAVCAVAPVNNLDQRGISRMSDGDKNGVATCDIGSFEVPVFTARSASTQDGWTLESGENTNVGGTMDIAATTFRLGDDAARKQYRSILSFNTSSLPDTAVITSVTLRVRRQGITGGGNPVATFQGFMVDIRRGVLGTATLQLTDWQATAQKTYGPFSTVIASGWYSIDLTAAKAYINKLTTGNGLTQIRLRFKVDDNNDGVANFLSLYSGNAGAASRPQLIVEYYVP
jgi:CSLREA domain-containing protein